MAHVTQLMELGVGIAAWIYVVRCCCALLRRLPDTWENIQWDFQRQVLCRLGHHKPSASVKLPSHIPERHYHVTCVRCYREISSPLSVVDTPAD